MASAPASKPLVFVFDLTGNPGVAGAKPDATQVGMRIYRLADGFFFDPAAKAFAAALPATLVTGGKPIAPPLSTGTSPYPNVVRFDLPTDGWAPGDYFGLLHDTRFPAGNPLDSQFGNVAAPPSDTPIFLRIPAYAGQG